MLTYVSVIKSFLYFYHISLPFIEQTRVASISRVRLRRLSICLEESIYWHKPSTPDDSNHYT